MTRARGATAAIAIAIGACASPPPPAPSAVIEASPSSVCAGDGFATAITLDASKSAPRLTLVYATPDPTEGPLAYAWSFSGAEVRVDDGAPTDAKLVVRVAGDRPAYVRLRVTNAEGGATETLLTLPITLRDEAGRCPIAP